MIWKNANPKARISVKLGAEASGGTAAAGVVKARADHWSSQVTQAALAHRPNFYQTRRGSLGTRGCRKPSNAGDEQSSFPCGLQTDGSKQAAMWR